MGPDRLPPWEELRAPRTGCATVRSPVIRGYNRTPMISATPVRHHELQAA